MPQMAPIFWLLLLGCFTVLLYGVLSFTNFLKSEDKEKIKVESLYKSSVVVVWQW